MSAKKIGSVALVVFAGVGLQGWAQGVGGKYAVAAPLGQYMMARDAEVAMARSAAPGSISGGAEVLVLGKGGYETVATGGNGFAGVSAAVGSSFWLKARAGTGARFAREAGSSLRSE